MNVMNNEQLKDRVDSLIEKIPAVKDGGYLGGEITKKTMYLPFDIQEEFVEHVKNTDDVLVIDIIELVPLLLSKGVNNVTYIDYGSECDATKKIVTQLGCTYVNLQKSDKAKKLQELQLMKQFDIILGNPPYNGKSKLHQQFFNKSVNEWLKDGGKLVFIQPPIAFYTNDDINCVFSKEMRNNCIKYLADVRIVGGYIFKSAAIASELAITKLHKRPTNIKGLLYSFTDRYGKKWFNIDINHVTSASIHPFMVDSVKRKINMLLKENGSVVEHLVNNDGSDTFVTMPESRGHVHPTKTSVNPCINDDWFTLIPKTENIKIPNPQLRNKNKPICGFKLKNQEEVQNCISYFQSYFARFCCSLYKRNMDLHCTRSKNSANNFVPVVDFSKSWTDEELFKLVGFTKEEIAEIYKVIPKYYD